MNMEREQPPSLKRRAFTALKTIVTLELKNKEEAREGLVESCQDADGPMQSTHDTTRQTSGWLMNAFSLQDNKILTALEILDQNVNTEPPNDNIIGRILTYEDLQLTREDDDENDYFFSVPDALGGREFRIDGNTYLTLSIESPILKSVTN